MRTWVKVTIAGVSIAVVALVALAVTGAYFVGRNLETRSATEADTLREFDAIRARFGARQPLLEIVDPQSADIRLHRTAHPEGRRASTIHVLSWNADDGESLTTEAPLWLMRFSSVNILSRLGVAPAKFRLTVEDVERYGPGIVVDYRRPGNSHVLIWVE
jgi:hypothetical protein